MPVSAIGVSVGCFGRSIDTMHETVGSGTGREMGTTRTVYVQNKRKDDCLETRHSQYPIARSWVVQLKHAVNDQHRPDEVFVVRRRTPVVSKLLLHGIKCIPAVVHCLNIVDHFGPAGRSPCITEGNY